jgi:hypothetical protein
MKAAYVLLDWAEINQIEGNFVRILTDLLFISLARN